MKRKIIFLDIDGVLNSNDFREELKKEYNIDADKVKMLASIVEKTNAEIVLHSAWRFWFDEELNPTEKSSEVLVAELNSYNLRITGVTPDLSTEEIRKTKKYSKVKAAEIRRFLSSNLDVCSWIVIDDLDLNDEEIRNHQVRPDSSIGLSKEHIEKAIKLL